LGRSTTRSLRRSALPGGHAPDAPTGAAPLCWAKGSLRCWSGALPRSHIRCLALPTVRAFGTLRVPPRPSAASSPGIGGDDSPLRPLPWHATSQGTGEASRGKRSSRRGIDAGGIKHRPLGMEGCAVACPLAPAVPPLLSGACPSSRTFVPRCLQTPPREDALALPLSFGSTPPWTGDVHPRA
jgi:hypothetical protein